MLGRYGKRETLKEPVADLLDSAQDLIHVDEVLMHREFNGRS